MPDLSFGLYSGYLNITGTSKRLHYVAALSQNDWQTDPVILWFNGGPGCSSMVGWAQEHGPYVVNDGQENFVKNDYSWNKEATVIYLDSPAGVGYSTCWNLSECDFNDDNSAADNLDAFLTLMTKTLPQLQGNDLYIAGESYAGIYVPKLAKLMDDYIANKTGPYLPKLKGIIVGNPVTDYKYDGKPAQFEMAYWFGLIDDVLYKTVKAKCDLSYWDFDAGNLSPECKNWMNQFNSLIVSINHYDFLGKCYIEPTPSNPGKLRFSKTERILSEQARPEYYFTEDQYTSFISTPFGEKEGLENMIPCVFTLPIYYYLNNRTVMNALHIPATFDKWQFCLDRGDLSYTKSRNGSIEIYSQLRGKYRMLVYSGDTDGVVSTYGTKAWINQKLAWPVTS